MKHQTYQDAMTHLALISLGNLVCSWLGLLWKERQQRRQYGTNNNNNGMGVPKPLPFVPPTRTFESSNPMQNTPIHVPTVKGI